MKNRFLLVFLFAFGFITAQEVSNFEKSPVFPECESQPIEELKVCFNNKINAFIFKEFKVPQIVNDESYKGEVKVLFEVDKKGEISVLYIDAVYEELKEETKRVFDSLPNVAPGTYNGKPTFYQYSLGIKIPLVDPSEIKTQQTEAKTIDLSLL